MATFNAPAPNDGELAASILRSAGEAARTIRAGGLVKLRAGSQVKSGASDFATAADFAAESHIFTALRAARPHDSIVGEEGAAHLGTSGRCWVIDPVDGTFNFASGSTYWCVAIALVRAPELVAGVGPAPGSAAVPEGATPDVPAGVEVLLGAVYQPEEDKLWLGGTEHAATLNGQTIRVAGQDQLGQLSAGTYLHPTWLGRPAAAVPWQQAAQLPATLRMMGSGSCDLARVAQGELGAWFQHSCPSWDWLPGKGLVVAAGGDTAVERVNGLDWFVAGPHAAVAQLTAALRAGELAP
ncbi:inositol monophosphatase family protein [Specibacter sp. NPDC057265]|uniref:inositol monophosphatase family protein n=1 Tax=Specibacter sp. NPDC057265 TaxID=3346075 RepID=UPI0036329A2F